MHELDHFNKLIEWLKIREAGGLDFPSSPDHFQLTMMKSSLLNRLLQGKEPLPIPPPKKYSYPWYSLIETGEGQATDVWEADSWVRDFHDYPTLYICQFPWKVIQKISEEDWIVTYSYLFNKTEKFSEDSWHVYKVDDYWIIKKLNAQLYYPALLLT